MVSEHSSMTPTPRITKRHKKFLKRALDELKMTAGNFYINDKSTGSVVGQQPFGGARLSEGSSSSTRTSDPPYFGTWRKRSKTARPRNPFGLDRDVLNYDVDSDDEWEEEEEGESLKGSNEDEKDNEFDNEYEVDNEFFVPHCHLSDDAVDDELNTKFSPESHKAKLKLLKNEFDEEMKSKTQKIKPRVLGCIWYNKTHDNVEEAIDRYLQSLAVITNGQVNIKERSSIVSSPAKRIPRQLAREHILKMIHGNVKKRKLLVKEFLDFLTNNGVQVEVSQLALGRQFKELAQWMKCPEQGAMHNRMCWYVGEDVRKEFNVDISLPNKWESIANKKDSILE